MLYGPLFYREDNEVDNKSAVFIKALDGTEHSFDELPGGYRIGRVSMYYPTDGREPFGGMEAVMAVVADYQAAQK